jgi:hypothetical protein
VTQNVRRLRIKSTEFNALYNAHSRALVLERGAASHNSFPQLPKHYKFEFKFFHLIIALASKIFKLW